MRVFVAVEVSEEQKNVLLNAQDILRQSCADIKYVEPENLHLTLKFLGEIQEQGLEKLEEEFKTALQGKTKFKMCLQGVGVFPKMDYIKIVWVGVEEGSKKLVDLADCLESGISVGKKEDNAFHPHVTVGRVKSAKNREALVKVLDELAGFEFGETEVTEVKLKKSVLGQSGAIYSDLVGVELE